MKYFDLCSWLLISAKLTISLKHSIIFVKSLEIMLGNKYCYTHSMMKQKSFGCHSDVNSNEFIYSDFLVKALSHQPVFKNALEKFNAPSF